MKQLFSDPVFPKAALDNHFPESMSTIAHCSWLRIVQAQTAIFVFLAVIVSGCATMSTGETIPDSNQVVIEVLYATDRKIDNPDGVTDFYSGQRGELRYGTCQVAINPQKNGISGNMDEQLWGLDSENPLHGEAELRQIKELNHDAFTDYLSTRIAQAEDEAPPCGRAGAPGITRGGHQHGRCGGFHHPAHQGDHRAE